MIPGPRLNPNHSFTSSKSELRQSCATVSVRSIKHIALWDCDHLQAVDAVLLYDSTKQEARDRPVIAGLLPGYGDIIASPGESHSGFFEKILLSKNAFAWLRFPVPALNGMRGDEVVLLVFTLCEARVSSVGVTYIHSGPSADTHRHTHRL